MVIAIALAALAAGYGIGVRRLWQRAGVGRGVRRQQSQAFVLALCMLAIALLPPLEPLTEELFAAHMVQHLLLAVVVPPPLLLGAPQIGLLWLLGSRLRRRVGRALTNRRMRATWSFITTPVVASLCYAVAIWMWHAPALYLAALHHAPIHALEHATLLGTGILIWWRIVHPRGERRAAYGVGIAVIFAAAMHTGILGALITASDRVLYDGQTVANGPFQLSAMADQQLAGLIMWVIGGVLHIVAIAVLFIVLLEPKARRAASRRVAVLAVTGLAVAENCRPAAANPVAGGDVERGRQTISAVGCGACHEIAGISGAHGAVGPPLTDVRHRAIIGGALPNTPENMILWIEDPPSISRTTAMPNLGLTPQQARDISAYLYTLR